MDVSRWLPKEDHRKANLYYDDKDADLFKGEGCELLKKTVASVKKELPNDWKEKYKKHYMYIVEDSHGIVSWIMDRSGLSENTLDAISSGERSFPTKRIEMTFSEFEPVDAIASCLLGVDEHSARDDWDAMVDSLVDFSILMKENIRKKVS